MSSVVHFQSGRSGEILDEEAHEAIGHSNPEDAVMVEVGYVDPLPCKKKQENTRISYIHW